MSFLTSLFLVVFVIVRSCLSQDSDPIVLLQLTLESFAQKQDMILQRFDEHETEMKSQQTMMQEQERKMEAQQTMLQEVSRRLTGVEAYMNSTQEELVSKFSREEQNYLTMTAHFNELANLRRSTEKCLTTDNINLFQILLAKDECLEGRPSCSASATCKDGIGHYKCVCMSGYSGDGLTCQDINECEEVTNICGEGGICINHPGTYGCLCQIGFIEINNFCTDVNECEDSSNNVCGEELNCINSPGNYSCSCNEGFRKQENTCQDINECETTNHLCHENATCTNTRGGYTCECLPYYYGDGFTCNELKSSNCKELLDSGVIHSGVYTITPEGFPGGVEVYCDQETDGGGWTVILRRQKQTRQVNFNKTFEEYASGFGDPNGEIWIGNRVLHSMTGEKPFKLRVDAKNLEGESRTGFWDDFSVDTEESGFSLSVREYSYFSTLGDSLWEMFNSGWAANGMQFYTIDRDNYSSCSAKNGEGGWWFNICFAANPTAPLGDRNGQSFIANWRYWERKGSFSYTAISEIHFLIRP